MKSETHFVEGIAKRYFDGLAERFPVMCSSDEFHFLPRSRKAASLYNRLDSLDPGAIADAVDFLKNVRNEIESIRPTESHAERISDLELLKANCNGVLIELEQNLSWRHNPLLYLKIAFIGLDHALDKPVDSSEEHRDRIQSRIFLIPALLAQARQNIESVAEVNHHAGLRMIEDCTEYLGNFAATHLISDYELEGIDDVRLALSALREFVESGPPVPDSSLGNDSLQNSLDSHFVVGRSAEEVFQIAREDWAENLVELNRLARKIDPGSSWQAIYHNHQVSDSNALDTKQLYSNETENLLLYFKEAGWAEEGLGSPVVMAETPVYLRSVRGTASFAAALTDDGRESSYFYITTRLPGRNRSLETDLLHRRFQREYRFLTAHETIPGHHYLDTFRRSLTNPVRQQIESPLFYEGWASYVESLLSESGYASKPIDRLIEHKRRLWRAARCQVDIGLPFGFLSLDEAVRLLEDAGFSEAEATRQIYRFRLNPGYQVCYCLGRYELMRLRDRFGTRMGERRFHEEVLQGGELPFALLEERLERLPLD